MSLPISFLTTKAKRVPKLKGAFSKVSNGNKVKASLLNLQYNKNCLSKCVDVKFNSVYSP